MNPGTDFERWAVAKVEECHSTLRELVYMRDAARQDCARPHVGHQYHDLYHDGNVCMCCNLHKRTAHVGGGAAVRTQ